MSIAIIGAGMAGAACARQLASQGLDVVVFDKGRSAGGRMSSKRTADGYLDFGAQYFTARSQAFQYQCQQWLAQGAISAWTSQLAVYSNNMLQASPDNITRYIGQPSMHMPVQQLLQRIKTVLNCCVDSINFDGKRWQLYCQQQQLGSFSQLIFAVPQQQAATLLASFSPLAPKLQAVFATPALSPCWAADIQLSNTVSLPYDGIFVKTTMPVTWLARQASKPGRAQAAHWLVHFSSVFSQAQLDVESQHLVSVAVEALEQVLSQKLSVLAARCHRWRYAQQAPDYPQYGFFYQPDLALGLCGDWLNGGRVENAWLSGHDLAQAISG